MQDSLKEKIEKRAYELFLKRGGLHGYAMEDWIQAEKEISAGIKLSKTAEKKSAPAIKIAEPAPKSVKQPAGKNVKKR